MTNVYEKASPFAEVIPTVEITDENHVTLIFLTAPSLDQYVVVVVSGGGGGSGSPEEPHYVGGVGEPAFENGWENYGPPFRHVRFWKDPFGTEHIEGAMKSGAVPGVAFTLPPGHSPPEEEEIYVEALSGGVLGFAAVASTGTVEVQVGSAGYFIFMDATFRV